MSSTSATLDTLASAGTRRHSLVARTVAVSALDAATRDAAFTLFRSSYEGTSRDRFEHDLAEKQHVILLHDQETGALKGFSTVLVQAIESPRGPATVVFSGDTVIDREYWGQKQLQLAFARLLATLKLRRPRRPLYWFLISKGYRTYLLLANAFPCAVPRAGVADDPALRSMLDRLAGERFAAQYDAARGVVRYESPHERVREGIAPVTGTALANRHVRFFVDRNPGHGSGDELACLADVRIRDLARVVLRICAVRVRRALGDGDRRR